MFSPVTSFSEGRTAPMVGSASVEALLFDLGGVSEAQFMDGWNAIFVGEVPGIATLLQAARERVPLYAFTNSNRTHQRVWSRQFEGVLGVFRTIFVSSEIGRRKPEPEAYRADIEAGLQEILR